MKDLFKTAIAAVALLEGSRILMWVDAHEKEALLTCPDGLTFRVTYDRMFMKENGVLTDDLGLEIILLFSLKKDLTF